jgi:hypothetical protein
MGGLTKTITIRTCITVELTCWGLMQAASCRANWGPRPSNSDVGTTYPARHHNELVSSTYSLAAVSSRTLAYTRVLKIALKPGTASPD